MVDVQHSSIWLHLPLPSGWQRCPPGHVRGVGWCGVACKGEDKAITRNPLVIQSLVLCCPVPGVVGESTHSSNNPKAKCHSFTQNHPLHISRLGFLDSHISLLVFAHAMVIVSHESGPDLRHACSPPKRLAILPRA